MRQLRWLFTLLALKCRSKSITRYYHEYHVMEHTYSSTDYKHTYKIKVVEHIYVVDYGKWFIPKIKKRIFDAKLTHHSEGKDVCVFRNCYPALSHPIVNYFVDDGYALAIVADYHLKKYLED